MPSQVASRPPSVVFVNKHYYPDVASTAQHLSDLAEFVADSGWHVTVLPGRARYVAGQMDVPDEELRNGVEIKRIRGTAFGRGTHVGRLVDYASYYVRVALVLLRRPRSEGVVFLTTPPLLAVIGRLVRALRGQRYGIWSMDLHPHVEVASGMLRPRGLIAKMLHRLNGSAYRHADFVVDLGTYMKQHIVRMGVAPARTHTVHVWNREEEVLPTPRDQNPLVDELGLRDKFVVMYSGNAGIVHDFTAILEAMRVLKDDPSIFFLFVGDGPQRPVIEAFVARHGIRNFVYRDYFSRDQLRFSLSVADVHLISLREAFAGMAVPGKLYGIMASARPALFVGPMACESAETITAARCGEVVDPAVVDAAARIVAILRRWSSDAEAAHRAGARGREAFLRDYERRPNCEQFRGVLDSAWVTRPATEATPVPAAHQRTVDATL